MSPQEPPVSHVDIYHKLGTLEGKLDALITRTTEYRNDLKTAFDRLTVIENKMAWVMGAAVASSVVVPIIVNAISDNFRMKIEQRHQKEAQPVSIIKNI